MAKKEHCCPDPSELKTIVFDTVGNPYVPQTAYTVPAGKILVVTEWTMVAQTNEAYLLRSGAQVTYSKTSDTYANHVQRLYPTGIAFAAGDELQFLSNSARHFLHGYETDA